MGMNLKTFLSISPTRNDHDLIRSAGNEPSKITTTHNFTKNSNFSQKCIFLRFESIRGPLMFTMCIYLQISDSRGSSKNSYLIYSITSVKFPVGTPINCDPNSDRPYFDRPIWTDAECDEPSKWTSYFSLTNLTIRNHWSHCTTVADTVIFCLPVWSWPGFPFKTFESKVPWKFHAEKYRLSRGTRIIRGLSED